MADTVLFFSSKEGFKWFASSCAISVACGLLAIALLCTITYLRTFMLIVNVNEKLWVTVTEPLCWATSVAYHSIIIDNKECGLL